MLYAGVDLGKRFSYVTVMDPGGTIVKQGKVASEPDGLLEALAKDGLPVAVAIEACRDWYWVYDLLDQAGLDVSLVHPLKAKAIASARIKSDRLDSRILAQLLRTDLLPRAYIPDKATRNRKELLRYRAFLVHLQTSIKNRIHALLDKLHLRPPYADVFCRAGLAWCKGLQLPQPYSQVLEGSLQLLEAVRREIDLMGSRIRAEAREDGQAQLLTTVPGVGYYTALLILSEIGEIERFPSARHLCSYAGLVPSTYASGNTIRHGGITRQGSRWLRWALVEATIHAVRQPGALREFYERLRVAKGVQAARTAAARKLLKAVYWMLKTGRPYQQVVQRWQEPGRASSCLILAR